MNQKLVSILIPCYCSELYLKKTVSRIIHAFDEESLYDYQIILVNDCSSDGTFEVIRELCDMDKRIVGVNLKENQGQTRARMIGYRFVSGDYLVFMDDDGQHSAENIFRLVHKLEEGYDIVYAQFPMKQETLFRKISGHMTDLVLTVFAQKPKGITITSFLAMKKSLVTRLNEIEQHHSLTFQTLASDIKKVGVITVDHLKREDGKSRYTLKKLVKMWISMVFSKKIYVSRKDDLIREIINDSRQK